MSTAKQGGSTAVAATAEEYLTRFEAQTPGSKALYEEAQRYTPGGIHHNQRYTTPYPVYMTRAKGSRVWDVDGNEYIDMWMGHGDAILGHAPPRVVSRVQEVAAGGLHIGHTIDQEVTLARDICEAIPSAEQVRFCVTGTEATMYAVRMARAFTGRNVILKLTGGWHGANTDLMVDVNPPEFIGPESRGLLPELTRYTRTVEINDIEGTAKAIAEAGDDFAGMILAPVLGGGNLISADTAYLNFLREETRKAGAILIFDEIVTGFRLALGGAQESYGIRPDLTTFGKIIGGGTPLGVIAGRSDILELTSVRRTVPKAEKVLIGGGTYSCNPLSMAAGIATLEELKSREQEIYPTLERRAARLVEGVQQAFDAAGIPLRAGHAGSMVGFNFLKEAGLPVRNMGEAVAHTIPAKMQELGNRLRARGVFIYKGGTLSTEHSDQDIETMIEAFTACANEMAEAG
ncbi:MAG: aspartate aminotransferase family protein [SAR324 cluster bacterium]|nr:aspartate aminotransferase family protein [SAR324 cluster bacterium]